MNNKKKGLIISGIILFFTLGVLIIKNLIIWRVSDFYWPSLLEIFLAIPVLPFLTLVWVFPESIRAVTILSFIIAIIFWLFVGYGIGYFLDKRKEGK